MGDAISQAGRGRACRCSGEAGGPFGRCWRGFTVACLASGPSLTQEDVERVKAWRQAEEGRAVIAVNTTFKVAPWADALYAMDQKWWLTYLPETVHFEGVRYTNASLRHRAPGVHKVPRPFEHHGNSGAGAISLAHKGGASRIILLGYDCQRGPNGEAHHHGDHPKGLGNAGSIDKWPGQFAAVARRLAGVEIINCSRRTALTCFPRADLEEVLRS